MTPDRETDKLKADPTFSAEPNPFIFKQQLVDLILAGEPIPEEFRPLIASLLAKNHHLDAALHVHYYHNVCGRPMTKHYGTGGAFDIAATHLCKSVDKICRSYYMLRRFIHKNVDNNSKP